MEQKRTKQEERWLFIEREDLMENTYLISDHGRVRSVLKAKEGKLMTTTFSRGFKTISLKRRNGQPTIKQVHLLVAEAFLKKKDPEDFKVKHLDFDKLNNHYENLEWTSHLEFLDYQKENPYVGSGGGANNCKLTDREVRKLKRILAGKKTSKYKDLAKEFGITPTQLNRIKNGLNWTHIK